MPTEELISAADFFLDEVGLDEEARRHLIQIAFETWVDLNGYRRNNQIECESCYFDRDHLTAIQVRIDEEIMKVYLADNLEDREIDIVGNDLSTLVLSLYFSIDHYITEGPITLDIGAMVETDAWLGRDIVVRIVGHL